MERIPAELLNHARIYVNGEQVSAGCDFKNTDGPIVIVLPESCDLEVSCAFETYDKSRRPRPFVERDRGIPDTKAIVNGRLTKAERRK